MALIPPGYLKAVVSLGVSEKSFQHRGTGFLYQHPISKKDDRTYYHTFLITNKHVIDQGVHDIRFSHVTDGSVEIHSIASVTVGNWTVHPKGADVAVIQIRNPGPVTEGRDVIKGESFVGDVGTLSDEEAQHIVEGDGVFVLGFPLGLVGEKGNYPIVRSGTIARVQNWLQGNEDTFLIDSQAFPGNSGGPVVLKPEGMAIKDTRKFTHSLLIGMIRSYIPSQDVAVSTQTGKTRVIFEENSGLAEVVPIDLIKQTLNCVSSKTPV